MWTCVCMCVCVIVCVCQVCSINVSLVASRWQKLTDDSRADTAVSHTEEGNEEKTVLTLLRLDLPQGWIQPLVDMMDYCNDHLNALFVMFKWQYILAGKGERGNLPTPGRGGKWCVWGVNKKVSRVHFLLTSCRWNDRTAHTGQPRARYCYWWPFIMCINQRPLKAIIR